MIGRPVPGTVIGGFVKDYPAEASGLEKKDKIVRINDVSVESWRELLEALDRAPGGPLRLTVERQGKERVIRLRPKVIRALTAVRSP